MFSFKRSLKNRWIKYYQKSNWPIVVDIASIFTVIALLILFFSLYLYEPEVKINNNTLINNDKASPAYIIDLDQPPLVINFSFVDNYINQQKLSSELKINLKNESPEKIEDLKIKISSLENNFSITDLNPKTIVDNLDINDNHEIKISKIVADEERELIIQINWSNLDFAGREANLKVEVEYLVANQLVKKTLNLKGPRVESKLKVEAAALYTSHDGDKLGLGPIPPIENLPTNYWIFLEVENEGAIRDFVMSARLAKNISLTDRYSISQGDFNYDEESRLAVWKIKEITENNDSIVLGLEIQLIPDEAQVGTNPILLDNINYFAKDGVSGRELKGGLEKLNTVLIHDKFNNNLGEVKSFSEY